MSIPKAWNSSATRVAAAQLARELGIEAFAVGGAIRDVLLGRDPHDWDVVCGEAIRLARAVAKRLDAAFVWLHDAPATARVVVGAHGPADEREELDFADFRSSGPPRDVAAQLTADLRARDFTINSLAWPLDGPPSEVFDPCGGLQDLEAQVIRANSRESLNDDPLRCLRAHRFSAELGFSVAPETAAWISQCARGLAGIAGERTGAEFRRIVACSGLSGHLQAMETSGVLYAILPELRPLKGLLQGGYHHLDGWRHTLLVIEEIEGIAAHPEVVFAGAAQLISEYTKDSARLECLKLGALLHDVGKPVTRAAVGERIRFKGHAEKGAQMVLEMLQRLRLPRSVLNSVYTLVAAHMRPIMLVDATEETGPTVSATRRMLRDADPDGLGLVILGAADLMACRGAATDVAEQASKLRLLDDMLTRYLQWQEGQAFEPILKGRDLIGDLGLTPGPHFSMILDAVEAAQADGEITTREEALELTRRMLAEGTAAGDIED